MLHCVNPSKLNDRNQNSLLLWVQVNSLIYLPKACQYPVSVPQTLRSLMWAVEFMLYASFLFSPANREIYFYPNYPHL